MVEVHVANGLPALNIVGLPETAVKESKDRVRGAILNSRFEFPAKRITVNLAPADLPKEGGRFDLAIALGILAASGQIPSTNLKQYECIGELSLSGELRAINGVLPIAIQARNHQRKLILAKENIAEAALVKGIEIIPASHLLEVCAHLSGQTQIQTEYQQTEQSAPANDLDFADVHGQFHVKRAFEIAAADAHNLIIIVSPFS
jgi:magnesium chelatase family protein